jgi:hypothetical protein
MVMGHTAILYRASTGPEQGFPCVLILTRKNLFSLQGTSFLIAGILYFSLQGSCIHYREFPVRISTQGNPCSHYREWVCSAVWPFASINSNHEGARHCRKPLGRRKGFDIFITLGLTKIKAFLYNSC